MKFPNYAGHSNVDAELAAELRAAGITPLDLGPAMKAMCRSEVKTSVVGDHHAWEFTRGWYYWVARGPGLPLQYAAPLHESHGTEVRVDGEADCPSPLEHFGGFAVGCYHIDTPAGLRALVEALNKCVEEARAPT